MPLPKKTEAVAESVAESVALAGMMQQWHFAVATKRK